MTNVLLFALLIVNCLTHLSIVAFLKYFKVLEDEEEENDIYDK